MDDITHGWHRVLGPPGTGKTGFLARQIHRAYATHADEIVVASFTRAAAAEIAGRDLPIDLERVGTLHSFAFRALDCPKIAEVDPKLKTWNASCRAEWRVEGAADLDDPYGEPLPVPRIAQQVSKLRALMIPPERWSPEQRAFFEAWTRWKRENGLVDFTDLLETVLENGLPLPFDASVGFLDEAQDLSPLEMAVWKHWASSMETVVMAGDPRQAVYGFRGGSPLHFMGTPDDGVVRIVLRKSHRLPRRVHGYAVEIARRLRVDEPVDFVPRDADGECSWTDARPREPSSAVRMAEEADAAGRRLMILGTCAYMLRPTCRELLHAGIPFWNPYRRKERSWNPLDWGGAEALRNFLQRPWTWAALWTWYEYLDERKARLSAGAKAALKDHVEGLGRMARHDVVPGEYLAALGLPADPSLLDASWLVERVLDSRLSRLDYPLAVLRTRGESALHKNPSVIVGTVHSVKGGEAEDVLLFPDVSRAAWNEHLLAREAHERDELTRVLYVGATRAKERLFVGTPSGRWCFDLPGM